MTLGTSLTKVIAPEMWYKTGTSRTCYIASAFRHTATGPATYLPRTRNVLQQLHDSVGNVFEGSQMDTLVCPELSIRHVAMVFDDLSNVLWWQFCLSKIHSSSSTLSTLLIVLSLLRLSPLPGLLFDFFRTELAEEISFHSLLDGAAIGLCRWSRCRETRRGSPRRRREPWGKRHVEREVFWGG